MEFKISKGFVKDLKRFIKSKNKSELDILLNDLHHADIAEILEQLSFKSAIYLFKVLDSEKTAEILLEF